MANAEYNKNPDLKYKVKGKHGLKRSAIQAKGDKNPAVKVKYPAIATKKGFKFIKAC